MSAFGPRCERCGRPALVHITSEVEQDGGVRHLCLACADQVDAAIHARDRNLNHRAILISVGLFTLGLSLVADRIGLGRVSGFGWKQDAALALGLLLLGVGALIRATTLVIIGGMVTTVTLLAGWMGLGSGGGFGFKQMTGTALGLVMIAGGVARIRAARLHSARPW